jgi:hypothetical protein
MPDRLRFVITPPAGAETAWGARWIIDQTGRVDEVWDRTDAIGPDDRRRELLDYLGDHVGRAAQETAAELLRSGRLRWSDEAAVTLYEDDVVNVFGNPRRSFGYLYVGAWFKADTRPATPPPDPTAPPKTGL